jgi:hypothetical protein
MGGRGRPRAPALKDGSLEQPNLRAALGEGGQRGMWLGAAKIYRVLRESAGAGRCWRRRFAAAALLLVIVRHVLSL